tara:strand:+ start:183 stop:392 length:210 start_codon:yes stop_codon:yes gene_type:complete
MKTLHLLRALSFTIFFLLIVGANAHGQKIEQRNVSEQNTYQTSTLKPGVYFINLSNQKQYTTTKKLVVK